MSTKIRKHLSYANVMASVAVFVVLGGGMAVAAGLKKNSVGKKQLKQNAIVSKKIADGAITTNDLAENAVTGAKAAESSFGQVPSAASADTAQTADTANIAETAETADTADTAQTAQNAQKAQNATTATTATNAQKAQSAVTAQSAGIADDATLFDGHSLVQVRSALLDDSTTIDDPLTIAEEQVDGLAVSVPNSGSGDVLATASITLTNNGGSQAAPQCRLRMSGTAITTQTLTTLPAGNSEQVSLVGRAASVNAGQVGVFCAGGSVQNDDVRFAAGDLVVEKVPVG